MTTIVATISKARFSLCNLGPVDEAFFVFKFPNSGEFADLCTIDIHSNLAPSNVSACRCVSDTDTAVTLSATFRFNESELGGADLELHLDCDSDVGYKFVQKKCLNLTSGQQEFFPRMRSLDLSFSLSFSHSPLPTVGYRRLRNSERSPENLEVHERLLVQMKNVSLYNDQC